MYDLTLSHNSKVMESATNDQFCFKKELFINAMPAQVWSALVTPDQMVLWMSQENPIEVITSWHVGSPFIIHGRHYKMPFENKGLVLQFQEQTLLSYSHLSSISRMVDIPENYSILEFRLTPSYKHTVLTFTASQFATETIYRHLAFYWNVTLEVLKRFVERSTETYGIK